MPVLKERRGQLARDDWERARAGAADERNATDEPSSLSLCLSVSEWSGALQHLQSILFCPWGFVNAGWEMMGGNRMRSAVCVCVGYHYSTVAEHHGLAWRVRKRPQRIELDDGGWQKDKEV